MKGKHINIGRGLFIAILLVIVLLWVTSSILDYVWFNEDGDSLILFLLPFHKPRELFLKILFVSVLLLSGGMVSRIYAKLAESEKQARDNETNLTITFNSIGDAVIATNAKGMITRMNPIAEGLTGWRTEEARGMMLQDVFKIINAKTRDVCENPVEKVIHTGKIVDLANHTLLISKEGKEYQIADSAAPIVDDEGRISGVVLVFRDVTDEYKQREEFHALFEALKQSENRLLEAQRMAHVGYWYWDVKTGDVEWSEEVYRIFHLDPATFVPQIDSIMELSPWPGDHERNTEILQRVIKTHEQGSYEQRFLRPDGSTGYYFSSFQGIYNDGGDVIAMRGTVQDITEQKRSEMALRESEEKFRGLVESSSDLIWETDAEGVFTYLSPQIESILGYLPEDVLGKNPFEFMPPDEAERVSRIFKEIVKTQRSIVSLENVCLHKDGHQVVVETSGVPVLNESGALIGYRGIDRDVTERKRAEEALEKRIVALTQPLDDVADITFDDLFNIDDIQHLQDEFANATGVASLIITVDGRAITKPTNFCRLCNDLIRKTEKGCANCRVSDVALGRYNPDGPMIQPCLSGGLWDAGAAITVGGKHIASWLVGQVRDDTQNADSMRQYAREIGAEEDAVVKAFYEVPAMSPEQFRKVAQALFTLANQLSAMAYQNVQQARFITESKRGETERAVLQSQLVQSQKLESVGRLAGGVAHDFNNMLGVILGSVGLLLDDMAPADPHYEALEDIQKAARRSADLTRQLLAFARKQTIIPKVMSLNDMMSGMLKMLNRLMGENIELLWEPGEDLWQVKMDPSQMDQILANLCVNARDAIDGIGVVKISTENVIIDEARGSEHPEAKPGEYVLLTVSDNGEGMEQGVIEHLFEPFFTTKPQGVGTGLGLSMVYGVVKQNDGWITVDSEPGAGTAFNIYLPRHEKKSNTEVDAEITKPLVGGHETLLLVEDEPMLLRMCSTILKRLGYNVLSAGSPSEAFRRVREIEGGVDLLITDVIMPEMNGRDLSERLVMQYSDLKRLYISGYTSNIIGTKNLIEDGMHFLQKPFQVEELAMAVRHVLDSNE